MYSQASVPTSAIPTRQWRHRPEPARAAGRYVVPSVARIAARIGFTLLIVVVCGARLAIATAAASGQEGARSEPSDGGTDAARTAERLKALQQEADRLLAQERTILVELRRYEVERALETEKLRQFEAERQRVDEELAGTLRHLELLERAHAEQTPALRARLVELYKLGSGGYARLLLGTGRPRDLGRAYRTVSALSALDRERARAHRSTLASLQAARAGLEARRTELISLGDRAAAARARLDRAVRERTALVTAIDSRRDVNAQLMGELQTAHERLQRAVSQLGPATAAARTLRALAGSLDWPAAGSVSAAFGHRAAGSSRPSTGIEIAVARGTAAAAVHEGTVAFAAPFTGFGNLVIVDHGDGAHSVYGYLDQIAVPKGAQVSRGRTLGLTGTPPRGEPALYFELRVDGRAVDPLQWLKPRR